ncbi:hypothetical protein RNJ44_02218 [Nakaseomyces bracarensis]|uniref:Protein kinase domain-containing protein n=1 Tax=Nakaseomyces bracarensis TaxID=273131 RepID=A0ABR4NMV2_9SACH
MSLYSYTTVSSTSFDDGFDSLENILHSDQTTLFKDGDLFKEQLDLNTGSLQCGEVYPEQDGLNNYKLIKKIGEGAFSRVFKAVPLHHMPGETREFVAIKVVPKEDFLDHKLKKTTKLQTLNELNIHLKLTKNKVQNIVNLLEFQISDKYYYFVQEYIEGGEIFNQIVKYTYLSEDLTRHIIKQVALAVKGLHENNVIHRDIKPENLIFEPIPIAHTINRYQKLRKSDDPKTKVDEGKFNPGFGGGGIGKVRLTDFGLSRLMDPEETGAKTPCGTFGYIAPEVLHQYQIDPYRSDSSYSYKVDIWAIGCILYTMLCGFPPFYEDEYSRESLGEKIAKGHYKFLAPWWDEISEEAKDLVMHLLKVDPNERYDINQLLAHPWLNHYDCEDPIEPPLEVVPKEFIDTSCNYVLASQNPKKVDAHRDRSILLFDLDDVSGYKHSVKNQISNQNIAVPRQNQKEELRKFFNVANSINREKNREKTTEATTFKNNVSGLFKNHFNLKLSSATIINRRKKMKVQNGIVQQV